MSIADNIKNLFARITLLNTIWLVISNFGIAYYLCQAYYRGFFQDSYRGEIIENIPFWGGNINSAYRVTTEYFSTLLAEPFYKNTFFVFICLLVAINLVFWLYISLILKWVGKIIIYFFTIPKQHRSSLSSITMSADKYFPIYFTVTIFIILLPYFLGNLLSSIPVN